MPRYTYTAKDGPQDSKQGYIEAESEQDAVNKLVGMGYFPTSVKYETLSLDKQAVFGMRRIPQKEIVLFTRQLSSLIDSGVNILNALNLVSAQAANKHLSVVLNDISGRIKDGKSLSDSLAAFPNLFSNLYCAMVRTGEASGKLNSALKSMTEFLEEQEEFKSSLRGALIYPAIVLIVSILTVVGLLVFVIPRLVGTLQDMGAALPLPTKILVDTSAFIRGYWWLIVCVIAIAVFLIQRMRASPKGRVSWDNFKLGLPLFGQILLKSELSRLTRTLSLLLSSGLPITPALDISGSILENQPLKQEVVRFKEEINRGSSLSASLKSSKLFPELIVNIVAIGEETGSLDKSLMRVAEDYEKEVGRSLKDFITLLEPVIILVMGAIVGFIVLAMLLPIFQINIIAR